MPSAAIDFGPKQRSGDHELGGASPAAFNVTVDGGAVVRRRPGIQAYSVAPAGAVDASGVSLLHETADGTLFAVDNDALTKAIYVVAAGVATDISAVSGERIVGARRPTIAETEAMVVFAGGGPVIKVEFAAMATAALGGNPPQGSHIVANNARLLLNNVLSDTNRIDFSGTASGSSVAGHETWGVTLTSGFFNAEGRPDPVVALHENTNEVFAFGKTTMQFFAPDPDSIYAPVTTRENGCQAPYSVVKADQAFAWLDHTRRIVVSDGRSLQVLSDGIQQTLNDIPVVSDCHGYRFKSGPVEALVFSFPTDERTFAYQVGGGWAQWAQYDGSNWTPFPVLCHHLAASSGENLVGLTDGRVCRLVNGVADDLGSPIVASVTSGFDGRGSALRKHTKDVRVCMKRGQVGATSGTVGLLRYRDDLGPWSDAIPVYVGDPSDPQPVISLGRMGWPYRVRQWQFEFSAAADYALAWVQEEYEELPT